MHGEDVTELDGVRQNRGVQCLTIGRCKQKKQGEKQEEGRKEERRRKGGEEEEEEKDVPVSIGVLVEVARLVSGSISHRETVDVRADAHPCVAGVA